MLLVRGGCVMAQNTFCVTDVTLSQNGEATLKVNFQFDAADTYTSYSFNIELPEELAFVMKMGTYVVCTKGCCHDRSHIVTANQSEGQVKAAFGDDVVLGYFTGTDPEFDESDNLTGIKANFSAASAIEANHQYIIMVSSAIEEFTVDGVDIEPDEDEAATRPSLAF